MLLRHKLSTLSILHPLQTTQAKIPWWPYVYKMYFIPYPHNFNEYLMRTKLYFEYSIREFFYSSQGDSILYHAQ